MLYACKNCNQSVTTIRTKRDIRCNCNNPIVPAIKELNLEGIIIVADTREQKNQHILTYCQSEGIRVEHRKLNYGDYSIIVNGQDFSDCLSVERKGSLNELAGNFTRGRECFEKEFGRMIKAQGRMIVVVENGSIDDIINHKYLSAFNPKAFTASIESFEKRFSTKFNFMKRQQSPQFIVDWLIENASSQDLANVA